MMDFMDIYADDEIYTIGVATNLSHYKLMNNREYKHNSLWLYIKWDNANNYNFVEMKETLFKRNQKKSDRKIYNQFLGSHITWIFENHNNVALELIFDPSDISDFLETYFIERSR